MRKDTVREMLLSPPVKSLTAAVMSAIIGIGIGFIILLICNAHRAVPAISTILTGGFGLTGFAKGFGRMCFYAMPLIMCGLSVGFAFRSGVLNIGASGQFIVGALAAVVSAIVLDPFFGRMTWVVAIILGGVAGGLWAFLPGILNAWKNVNSIISGIMMNYIGVYSVNLIIKKTPRIYEPSFSRVIAIPDETQLPKWGLDNLFPRTNANSGFIIALVIGVLIFFLIDRTVFGYELRNCGMNRNAAKYAGMNDKKAIVLSMVISGALAGIGGAIVYLSNVGTRLDVADVIPGEGFIGISVALLGNLHPIGILLSGFFVSFITVGGFNLQIYGFDSQIINVILAIIIFSCAFAGKLKMMYSDFIEKIFFKESHDPGEDSVLVNAGSDRLPKGGKE